MERFRLNKMPAHSPFLAEGQEAVKPQGDFLRCAQDIVLRLLSLRMVLHGATKAHPPHQQTGWSWYEGSFAGA